MKHTTEMFVAKNKQGKTQQIAVRITSELQEKLEIAARFAGTTTSEVIRDVLHCYLQAYTDKKEWESFDNDPEIKELIPGIVENWRSVISEVTSYLEESQEFYENPERFKQPPLSYVRKVLQGLRGSGKTQEKKKGQET